MSFSQIIQIVIYLIFIYLLLSLIVSEIQEAISSILEFRANRLKTSLFILFGEDKVDAYNMPSENDENDGNKNSKKSKKSLTNLLYESPLIASLNQRTYKNYVRRLWQFILSIFLENHRSTKFRFSTGPSYIDSSETFANALIDTLQDELSQLDSPQYLKNDDTVDIVTNKLQYLEPKIAGISSLIRITEALRIQSSNATLADFSEQIQKIFVSVQKRSSGVYKRNARGVSFLLGFMVAVIANADTFQILRSLNHSPTKYTTSLSTAIEENSELFRCDSKQSEGNQNTQDTPSLDCIDNFVSEINPILESIGPLPLGWNYTPPEKSDPSSQAKKDQKISVIDKASPSTKEEEPTQENQQKPLSEAEQNSKTIQTEQPSSSEQPSDSQQNEPKITWTKITQQINHQGGLFKATLGWLVTAIAIAMGAPFWFDLLGRILNVRNAGAPPNEEKS
ncbi:hypothetical protein [Acaryochloris marina]|uniref:Uncharacterized protein n=1 Tax=Acaryochloris marina (strain MBIC 11017) TaxID=329726 RepID=B0CEN5_ACAM1|nr:hypothetical protein [Acaryochloris marina]ABW28140.1 hypothetical protein AM1_3144 [Acaryochloris marina MBIC11017]